MNNDTRDDFEKRCQLRNQVSLKFYSSEVQDFITKITKDILKATEIDASELIGTAPNTISQADVLVECMLAEMLTSSKIKL